MERLRTLVSKKLLIIALTLVLQACNAPSNSDLSSITGNSSSSTTTTTTTTTVNGPLGNSALTFAPPFYSFATLTANSGSATNSFLVKNTSAYSIYLGTITGATTHFTLTANTCTNNLLLVQNAECTFTVQFAPLTSGSLGAVFTIPYDLTQGVNGYSSSVSVTGSGTTLTSFAGITSISSVTSISATLNWTNVAGVGTYQAYKIVSGSPVLLGNVTPAAACVAGACTYSATGLTPSTAYTFRVRATDTFGVQELNIVNLSTTTMAGVLKLTGATSAVAGSCASVTVTTQDGSNNPINMGANTTVTIGGLGSGALFSDAGCTSALANPIILSGTSAITFYFKDTLAETATLTASLTAYAGDSRAIVVSADVADHLVYVAGNTQSAVAQATLAVNPKVQVTDRYGNAVSGVSLAFLNERGGGFCTSNSYVTSDAQGYASVSFKNGPYDIKNTLRVKRVGTELPDLASSGNKNYLFTQTVSAASNSGVFQQHLVTTGSSTDVANGDFNGDGKKDLVSTNYSAASISVYLAQSNGSFTTATNYTTGTSPYTLAIGDLNGDTKLDIVVTNIGSTTISVFLNKNDGTGTFFPKADYTPGGTAYGVVIHDMTGDGLLDIATSNYSTDTVTVFTNNGGASPSFSTPIAPASYAAGAKPRSVTAGDFNGDGKPDLAASINEAGAISVYYGTGSAGSYTLLPKSDVNTGGNPWGIAAGDINNDGRLDLVTTRYTNNIVTVLLGQGASPPYTFAAPVNYAGGGSPLRTRLIDINNDTFLDLVSTDYAGASISAYINNGSGGYPTLTSYDIEAGGQPYSCTIFDADGDGKLDIYYGMYASGYIGMLKGSGTGTFRTNARILSLTGVSLAGRAVDLNNDGKMDFVAATYTAGTSVDIFIGNGNGSFQNKTTATTGSQPAFFDFGDFNQDGKTDIVAPNYSGASFSLLLGNGDGTFQPKSDTTVASGVSTLVAADFNKDGKLDVAAATYTSLKIQILLGNGNGTFGAPTDIMTGGFQPYGITAGDIDGDGDIDIAATIYNNAAVNVFKNNGSGTFGAATSYSMGTNPHMIRFADLNGDGALDMITDVYVGNVISVNLNQNNGTGAFNAKSDYGYSLTERPLDVQVADVDGDGKLDIISGNYTTGYFSIFKGTGSGSFGTPSMYKAYAFGSRYISVADFDGDGKMDISVTGTATDKAVIYFGW